jgi:hypothetical protein
MSEQEYRRKADLWPLNPEGELVNRTIVESKEGLAHVREIAAVKGLQCVCDERGATPASRPSISGARPLDEDNHRHKGHYFT